MKIEGDKTILFIEPTGKKSDDPVIDTLTIKMFNALNKSIKTNNRGHIGGNGNFTKGLYTLGVHECICGKGSTSCDYMLSSNQATNFLCVHYLAYHRDEIPMDEIKKVESLDESDILEEADNEHFLATI